MYVCHDEDMVTWFRNVHLDMVTWSRNVHVDMVTWF